VETLVGNVQICLACGREFGTDHSVICSQCKGSVCPHCWKCNCALSRPMTLNVN